MYQFHTVAQKVVKTVVTFKVILIKKLKKSVIMSATFLRNFVKTLVTFKVILFKKLKKSVIMSATFLRKFVKNINWKEGPVLGLVNRFAKNFLKGFL